MQEPDDLSPELGGGPVAWPFEARRPATTFKMPADVEAERIIREAEERMAAIERDFRDQELQRHRARYDEARRARREWAVDAPF